MELVGSPRVPPRSVSVLWISELGYDNEPRTECPCKAKSFVCVLPLCYRNTPTQAHPARSRLLRFLVFLLRYRLLGLLSLVNRTSLNQRAIIYPSVIRSRVLC